MYKIAFFGIPAFGHTNPTIEVVRELTGRGHEVWYYSYQPFQKKIEDAGAKFIACDPYDISMGPRPGDADKVGRDVGFAIKLLVNTALALDEMVCRTLKEWKPDCVIADSMAVWGKFAALKLNLPFVSSTTTFAFNRYSAKIMKQSLSQLFFMIKSMPGIKKDLEKLQAHGYPVKNLFSILQNENDVDTIVYTSKEFQPCSETFSDRYVFVGPSVKSPRCDVPKPARKTIYISMGTVNNRLPGFYKNCMEAFRDSDYHVILSVGEETKPPRPEEIPRNFTIQKKVDQIAVLQNTDVFLSHCGMNSVNESLYYGVPLVLFPQTAEQGGVANRVAQLEAGVFLKKNKIGAIKTAINTVLEDAKYRKNAEKIAVTFRKAGGASTAADAIVTFIGRTSPALP